jgi:hypothetical protein
LRIRECIQTPLAGHLSESRRTEEKEEKEKATDRFRD